MPSASVRVARVMAKFWKEHKVIAEYSGGKVLDVGFSQRPNTLFKPECEIIGLDMKLPRKKPSNYSKMVRGDAQKLSKYFKKGEFDTISASNLIEHLENPTQFLRECSKVLRPDGTLIISTDNPYRWQTLFGNVFLKKGTMSSDEHILYCQPRNLNKMALRTGFRLLEIKCGEGLSIPFLQEKLIYIYQKIK